jgi:hypothetical protein
VGTSNNALLTSSASVALNYPRPVTMNGDRGSSQILGAHGQHPTGSLVTTNIFFCRNCYVPQWRARAGTSQGPTIDVFFNFGDGYCWSYRQHLPGGSNRCLLQFRWWLLPDLSVALPRGTAIDIFFNFGGGCYWCYRQHLPGGPPWTSSQLLW